MQWPITIIPDTMCGQVQIYLYIYQPCCCCTAGVTDHLAESEPHAISIARNILGNLNMAAAGHVSSSSSDALASAPSSALGRQGLQLQEPSSGGMSHLLNGAWEEPLFPAEQLRGKFDNYEYDL